MVAGGRGAERSMAMTGEVGSGFTSATAVTVFRSLILDGDEGLAGVIGREGWNGLAVGLRGGSSGFAGAGVVSESLISPSSLGVESTTGGGCGVGVVLVDCTGGLGGVVVDSLSP